MQINRKRENAKSPGTCRRYNQKNHNNMTHKPRLLLLTAFAALAIPSDASAFNGTLTLANSGGSKMVWSMNNGTAGRLKITNWSNNAITGYIAGAYWYTEVGETDVVSWTFSASAAAATFISPANMAAAYMGQFSMSGYDVFQGVPVYVSGVITAYKIPGYSDTGVNDPCTYGTFYHSAGQFSVWAADNDAPYVGWQ